MTHLSSELVTFLRIPVTASERDVLMSHILSMFLGLVSYSPIERTFGPGLSGLTSRTEQPVFLLEAPGEGYLLAFSIF